MTALDWCGSYTVYVSVEIGGHASESLAFGLASATQSLKIWLSLRVLTYILSVMQKMHNGVVIDDEFHRFGHLYLNSESLCPQSAYFSSWP